MERPETSYNVGMTRFASDPIYLLVEFPVSDSAPMREQQLAHRKWMLPLVKAHGGKIHMALKSDQLHGFGLDVDPPMHYYGTKELDNAALLKEYVDLKWQAEDRIAKNQPWNWYPTLVEMVEEMQNRKIAVPDVTYPGDGPFQR